MNFMAYINKVLPTSQKINSESVIDDYIDQVLKKTAIKNCK